MLSAADKCDDFYHVAFLQCRLWVFFARDDILIHFHRYRPASQPQVRD